MKKSKSQKPNRPTKAIVTPDRKDPKTGMTIPNLTHVKAAKDYVDANEK